MQSKTGVLSLEAEKQQIRVFFSEGKVAWVEDSIRDPEMRLGVLLSKSGKVDKAKLDQALSRQKETKERLGLVLLNMGAVSGIDLERTLERQVFDTASQVFRWKGGRYRFTPQRSLDIKERLLEPLRVENLLLDAMRMLDEWPLIEREIPSFDSILAKAQDLSSKMEAGRLSEEDREVLGLVDGARSIGEIVEASHLSEFDTCKILAGFVRSGAVQARSPAAKAREAEAQLPPTVSQETAHGGIAHLGWALGLLLLAANLFIFGFHLSPLVPLVPLGEKEAALARVYRAKSDIKGWSEAARRFHAESGNWPSGLKELKSREKGMGLAEKDPWGNTYRGQVEAGEFYITSLGEDGIERTDDDIRGGEAQRS
jgi:hypothetical protein